MLCSTVYIQVVFCSINDQANFVLRMPQRIIKKNHKILINFSIIIGVKDHEINERKG